LLVFLNNELNVLGCCFKDYRWWWNWNESASLLGGMPFSDTIWLVSCGIRTECQIMLLYVT